MIATPDEFRALIREAVRSVVREELRAFSASVPLDPGGGFQDYEQAAAVARVKPATIGAWVRRGLLKRHGTKAVPLVKTSELLKFLESGPSRADRPQSPEERARALLEDGDE